MPKILYLDQNAWVILARGAWDKDRFPREHDVLIKVVEGVRAEAIIVPLTFANIYETSKINDPVKRANMARTQSVISAGRVYRGRRRILREKLASYLAGQFSIARPEPEERWFLSDLWFESAADFTPETFGFEVSPAVLDAIRADPAYALFDYLSFSDEGIRKEAVRRNSAASAEFIARIESRRKLVAGEPLPIRRRAYGARMIIDELDSILATGRQLGLEWRSVTDLGRSLVRSIPVEVPILHVERELVIRLEDQARSIQENDIRDMAAFMTVIPFADIVIAEKPFVNLARQAKLHEKFEIVLMTSIFDL